MSGSARIVLLCAGALVPRAEALDTRQIEGASKPALERAYELTRAPDSNAAPLSLALPNGEYVVVHLERYAQPRAGSFTSYGALASDPLGYAAFSSHADAFVGVIRNEGRTYRVRRSAQGEWSVEESVHVHEGTSCQTVNVPLSRLSAPSGSAESQKSLRGTGPARDTTPGPLQPTFATQVPSSVGDTVVDVLVGFTPEASVAAGGQAAVLALIDLATLETNVAFENSHVNLFLRVVSAGSVAYTESGSMAIDLDRLRVNGDGFLDSVHSLRDSVGADAVSLFVANDSACGRSYNMGAPPSAGFAEFAFNLVSQGCATGFYAYGHEFGHNFGLNHDRPTATGTPSYPYAYGSWSADNTHRTIMALKRTGNFGVRVQYFSNPDVVFEGFPLGIPDPDRQSADCATALNNNASIIAAWRPTMTP